MNPEDFTFDPNYHYDYFNNYYYDKTMGWSNCNDAYRIIEDNRILLNVNYIGVKTIYIERPNCEDLINIKELNPAVIVDNNLKTLANYADSFDDTEGKEKGKEITINNIEEIEVSTGRFNSSNFQRELSEEEFYSITTNEKFRN